MAKKTGAKATVVGPANAGFIIGKIFNLTKIDRWFLVRIKGIADSEEELAKTSNKE
jgi:hypothetical protein